MKAAYQASFIKDLRRLRGHAQYERIRRLVFEDMPGWASLRERSQIKCLSAQDNAYRIRVGDWAITGLGFTVWGNSLPLLACCTGRKSTAISLEDLPRIAAVGGVALPVGRWGGGAVFP